MDISKMMVSGWEGRYYSLSRTELQRRLESARAVMREKEVSVMLVLDMVRGGFFQWFLGAGISERPTEEILIVPSAGQMKICLSQECFTKEQQESYQKLDAVSSQDSREGDAQNVPALYYGDIGEHLKNGDTRVGIVYPDDLRVTVKQYLENHIPGITYVDCTRELNWVKAKKSSEERSILEQTAAQHDRLFGTNPYQLRPGRLEADVVRELRYRACQLGSGGEDMTRNLVVEFTSAPMGEPAVQEPIRYPGRRIQEKDRVNICLQGVFQDNYYGILGRCYTMGPATEQVKHHWQTAIEAQRTGAAALRPGATILEASEAINQYLRQQGCPEDNSTSIYGIAYKIGEIPCRYDESEQMPLEEGMVLALKPKVYIGEEDPYCCADPYEITKDGARRLTKTSQALVELFIQ